MSRLVERVRHNAKVARLFAEDVKIDDKPEVVKAGYELQPLVIDNKHIAWQFVKIDGYEEEKGSYTNPIEWIPGMWIVGNSALFGEDGYVESGWYKYNGLTQRCIKSGSPEDFNDSEYFEIAK